jgi:hypothetical protein
MDYRGQNPNMHCVEALLAAYKVRTLFPQSARGECDMRRVVQVTRSDLYLLRANKIAVSVTQRSDPAHPQPLHISPMALTCACTDLHPSPRQALSGSISR